MTRSNQEAATQSESRRRMRSRMLHARGLEFARIAAFDAADVNWEPKRRMSASKYVRLADAAAKAATGSLGSGRWKCGCGVRQGGGRRHDGEKKAAQPGQQIAISDQLTDEGDRRAP